MAAKPVSALTPSLSQLCIDEISLKPLTNAVRLNCRCYYNEETAVALALYKLPCIQHERVHQFYGDKEDRVSSIIIALLKEGTTSLGKELTSANVSGEIPPAAKSLFEKGKAFFEGKLFKEAARAFLGATLHSPGYTEAKQSLDTTLKFLADSSSSPVSMPTTAAKPPITRPLLKRLGASPKNASAPIYSPPQLVYHDNHLP